MKTRLSNNFTIENYLDFKRNQNKKEIVRLIIERINERFIDPSLENPYRHGFAMMAIGCLTIEAFQGFKMGNISDKGIGGDGFKAFFIDHKEFGLGTDNERGSFYSHIRCGLLHDAEARGGWRIIRTGLIFDKSKKTINATRFMKLLKKSISDYFQQIEKLDWNKSEWKNVIKKLDSIVEKSQERS